MTPTVRYKALAQRRTKIPFTSHNFTHHPKLTSTLKGRTRVSYVASEAWDDVS